MMNLLRRFLADRPIIAILRGLKPEEAPNALDALKEAGVRILEVPLNSPRPMESLARLVPVGGITLDNMAGYFAAGAAGVGIGSALYQPGMTTAELHARALAFVGRCRGTASPGEPAR